MVVLIILFGIASGLAGILLAKHYGADKPKLTTTVPAVYKRIVPKQAEESKPVWIHRVRKGDSLWQISQDYVVLLRHLREANGMTAADSHIEPGQKISVPIVDWSKKPYTGIATFYCCEDHGKDMANGEPFDQYAMTVAHRSLPLGLKVRVTNLKNKRSLIATVTDRGPNAKKFGKYHAELDLSLAGMKYLAGEHGLQKGKIPVRIEPLPPHRQDIKKTTTSQRS